MGKDDGQRTFAVAALMDEMNAKAVHIGSKVCEAIDGLFLPAPIKAGQPMLDQLSQVRRVRPMIPAGVLDFVRPPDAFKPVVQIVECLLWDPYLKGRDTHESTSSRELALTSSTQIGACRLPVLGGVDSGQLAYALLIHDGFLGPVRSASTFPKLTSSAFRHIGSHRGRSS